MKLVPFGFFASFFLIPALAGMPAWAAATPAHDFLLVPGQRAGFITKDTSRAQLEALGGVTAKERLEDGESLVTTLDRGTPKEIKIFWDEKQGATLPALACVYQYGKQSSLWHTKEGIQPGLVLAELEKIAGARLTFSGFAWDYGGRVLDGLFLSVMVGLAPSINSVPKRYLGDVLLYSDDPQLQVLGIRVTELCMGFTHGRR